MRELPLHLNGSFLFAIEGLRGAKVVGGLRTKNPDELFRYICTGNVAIQPNYGIAYFMRNANVGVDVYYRRCLDRPHYRVWHYKLEDVPEPVLWWRTREGPVF